MKLSRAYAKVTNREGGSHIRALIKVLAAAIALAMSTGTAFAVMSKTTTDVALRTAPGAQTDLILNLPKGALVNVGFWLKSYIPIAKI
jgi:uncharacterized protein YraI